MNTLFVNYLKGDIKIMSNKNVRVRSYEKLRSLAFEAALDKLSAEYILLDKAEQIDAQAFTEAFSMCTHTPMESVQAINGKFICNGQFISYDKKRASKALYKLLLDFWLKPQELYIGDREIRSFKESFFDQYFSKLCEVEIAEETERLIPQYKSRNLDNSTKQCKVLKGIIAGYLREGDNVFILSLSPYSYMRI